MYVTVCRLTIGLPGSHSLKDKRKTVRSISDRLRHRFKISVAEVDSQDAWQRAVIGFSAVSYSERIARDIIESAADYAETLLFDVNVLDCEIDVIDMR